MKKQFFFSMLAAAAMMASCTSDKIVENSANNEYGLIEGQPAFINIGIAMPGSSNTTRANDNFNDGIAGEYDVFSGHLVLFKGSAEATATLFESFDITSDITSGWTNETSNPQITTTSKKFVKEITAPNLSSSEKLFAYVILNDAGNATGLNLTAGRSFKDFSEDVFKAIGIVDESLGYGARSSNGFVMTSVPLAQTLGGTTAPTGLQTLTPINASAVYATKAEAEDGSAQVSCCYVERAAVKVEVKLKSAGVQDPILGAGHNIDASEFKWALGNVNSNAVNSGYYNTRQVETAWYPYRNMQMDGAYANQYYRFASYQPLFSSAGHTVGYRTYFGRDVNYDTATPASKGLIDGLVVDTKHTLANEAVTYTYENTFDEDNQKFGNTTYASLKVKLNGGAKFWTIDGQNDQALTESLLKTTLGSKVNDQIGATTIATIKSTINAKLTADLANVSGVLRAAGFTGSEHITYTLVHDVTLASSRGTDGTVAYEDKLKMTDLEIDGVAAIPAQEAAIGNVEYATATTIATKLAENLTGYTKEKVYQYDGGIAYYAVRIAHFGDIETPWDAPNEAHNIYDKIYPNNGQSLHDTPRNFGASRAAAWLGRWGIVRNNWYQIEIQSISGIGDAVPVDYTGTATGTPGETPDDNPQPKYYIAAHIHILPWVLRTQSVQL